MKYEYLNTDTPLSFQPSDKRVAPVLFNPHKTQFCLIASPGVDEIRLLIEEYGQLRLEAHWSHLMEISKHDSSVPMLRAFGIESRYRQYLPKNILKEATGATIRLGVRNRLAGLSREEQIKLLLPYKPRTIPEMLDVYLDYKSEDCTGYRYFISILDKSKSSEDFFGTLIDNLFRFLKGVNAGLPTLPTERHQARTFELLGMALSRGWLLFPFAHVASFIQEHRVLNHRQNVNRYFSAPYRRDSLDEIIQALDALPVHKTTNLNFSKHFRSLVCASTFRSIEQCSRGLLEACIDLIDGSDRNQRSQSVMAQRTFNALIKIHNSRVESIYRLADIPPKVVHRSVAEFSSFQELRDRDPKWEVWATAFEQFIADVANNLAYSRRLGCVQFAAFLVELTDPPLTPELMTRGLINNYDDNGFTYRNFLDALDLSADSKNARLVTLSTFFDWIRDRERTLRHKRDLWLPNPVDMKFDRFVEKYCAGTHRKAVPSHIMEMMRNILVADDYAWPKKTFPNDWAPLVNHNTGEIGHVWSPSATILLYCLLSVPLRGVQGRLLDSGEGDAEIYDFDSGRMVPNPNQLPVEGRLDPHRREGVLRIMPSGMRGISDITGLWISTNKTSDHGYEIPWVSEDLMRHLRYQREFISRFAANPRMHTLIEAQGFRSAPKEWSERAPKFYCLFRDPSVVRTDPSLPVSKQKLLRIWAALCAETQNRMNADPGIEARITLIRPGTENNRVPKTLFDIHTLRVSGITDLLDRGVPLNIVSEYVAGHATYIMTLWYDKPTPGAIRAHLQRAQESIGDRGASLPNFSQDELDEMKPYLLSHPDHQALFNGFDALKENKGLILLRQSGICPGTVCSEGGLDENQRASPVPMGDRGPSCPQCRFWLTGPAFLLGQVIEGNQLIAKIRNKIQSLASMRNRIMDAEDAGSLREADLLKGQCEIEERQLNDMLTEWWHRMRFYEASVAKLDAYQAAQRDQQGADGAEKSPVVLFSQSNEADIRYSFSQATELELKHFLSTCAEILPEFSLESTGAKQDIELAVGRFLAINNEREMTSIFFKLNDEQRLKAANLAVELMLQSMSPSQVENLLEGSSALATLPELQRDLARMLDHSSGKAFSLSDHLSIEPKEKE